MISSVVPSCVTGDSYAQTRTNPQRQAKRSVTLNKFIHNRMKHIIEYMLIMKMLFFCKLNVKFKGQSSDIQSYMRMDASRYKSADLQPNLNDDEQDYPTSTR